MGSFYKHTNWFIILSLLAVSLTVYSQEPPPYLHLNERGNQWVDSVLNSLTPDERIGQLMMVSAYSNRDQAHVDSMVNLVCNYNIGGLIFFQGGPVRQAILTNEYQVKAKTPLLISIDGEWGLAMRLDSTMRFPRQMTMGGIEDNQMIYDMGAEIARQCKRLGIHVNLAPVVDINNNPRNPVISNRSFGEDKENVTNKAIAYMMGMQENGILANAKHFPGHGDTESDSHFSLPIIRRTKEGMDTLELYPFRRLIKQGLGSVMVAHLYIPAYDSTMNTASTLSKSVVTDLLKNQLSFQGLIFTDALNMQAVSAYYKPGMVDVKALLAGNDVLLYSEDVPRAILEIKKAVERGEIGQVEIDSRVKKILAVKYWAGLSEFKPIEIKGLQEDLNESGALWLDQRLHEEALTLLVNKNDIIPFERLDTLRIASLVINDSLNNIFQQTLNYYAPVDLFQIGKNPTPAEMDNILRQLEPYNLVIVSIHNTLMSAARNYGITESMIKILNLLSQKRKVVLDIFGNPYTLSRIIGVEDVEGLLMSYEGSDLSMSLSAQLLFGGVPAKGQLAVTASNSFKVGDGLQTGTSRRLKYTLPEEVGLSSRDLLKIDSIAKYAIEKRATPGCQVLVAKEGKVIYYKSFGHHTYDKKREVRNTDLYDIASVTKISATALVVMKLYDRKKISLDKKISKYLPDLKGTNKEDITLREMLTHQSGLQGWIPFWMRTLDVHGNLSTKIYRSSPDDSFTVKVADRMYIRKDYADTMWQVIKDSPVSESGKYVYSDLGLIIMKRIVEKITRQPLDTFVYENFYRPLGIPTLCFNPLNRYDQDRIVPTENDTRFRKQLVHGYVHDPASAMMCGVSGHAGLFSDASDLAIIAQMLLQKGEYARERLIRKETIEEFTTQQYTENENRRGIVFDKPEVDITKNGPTAKSAPYTTFGHTGFTGTCMWVDPDNNLVYIFLSNRVYPDAANNKLANLNIRTEIQQVIYDAIRKAKMVRN